MGETMGPGVNTRSKTFGALWPIQWSPYHLVADLGKIRNVHRNMLIAVIPSDAVGCATTAPPSPSLYTPKEDSLGSETWFLLSEVIAPFPNARSFLPQPLMAPLATSQEQAGLLPPASSMSPSDQPSTSQQALRQTFDC